MSPSTLEEYLQNPFELLDFPRVEDGGVVKRFLKLFDPSSWFYFTKVARVKKLMAALIDGGVCQPFSLKVVRKLAKVAYMHDSGVVYLSYGIFALRASFFSVLTHELSHVWLSQQPFYAELKRLDHVYREKFANEKEVLLAAPIEVWARTVSVHIMQTLLPFANKTRYKTKLNKCLDDENKKIVYLSQVLQKLRDFE